MRRLTVLAAICLCTLPASAQLSRDQLRADLDYLAAQLPRLHIQFFARTQEPAFRAAVEDLANAIPSLTTEEFFVRLTALVAMGPDAHTVVGLTSSAAINLGFRQIPMLLRSLDNGVFVTAAPSDKLFLNRAQLIAIGETPIEQAIEQLRPIIPHENEGWFRAQAPAYLRMMGMLRGLGLAPAGGPARLTFRLASGEMRTVEMEPYDTTLVRFIAETEGHVVVSLRNLQNNYWHEYRPESGALVVVYRVCADMPSYPFATFLNEVSAVLNTRSVKKLVLDVRGNGGGNSLYFDSLVTTLKPRLLELGAQDPEFHVYMLHDSGTFSSGMLAVEQLSSGLGGARPGMYITLGEPTGGKPASFGEVRSFELPNSHVPVNYATKAFAPFAGIPDRDAIYPQRIIRLRSTDYYARHDPVLAAILTDSRQPPDPPAGEVIVVNAASFRVESGIAPGSLATAFSAEARPTSELLINGSRAPIVAAVEGQIVFRVPADTAAGAAEVELRNGEETAGRGEFEVTTAGPGIFVLDLTNPSQPGAVVNQDGAINGPASPAQRATIVAIFATGYGPLDENGQTAAEVWIAEQRAELIYSGPAPTLPGVWQINARIPDTVPAGDVPLFVASGGLLSNGVTLRVREYMLNKDLPPFRKYPSVLREFRKAVEYNPDQKKAKENIATIEGIYKSMGREVPK